jgi:hypothetical protein
VEDAIVKHISSTLAMTLRLLATPGFDVRAWLPKNETTERLNAQVVDRWSVPAR